MVSPNKQTSPFSIHANCLHLQESIRSLQFGSKTFFSIELKIFTLSDKVEKVRYFLLIQNFQVAISAHISLPCCSEPCYFGHFKIYSREILQRSTVISQFRRFFVRSFPFNGLVEAMNHPVSTDKQNVYSKNFYWREYKQILRHYFIFTGSTCPSQSMKTECLISCSYEEQATPQNIVPMKKAKLAIFLCVGSYSVRSTSRTCCHLSNL